MTHFNVNPSSSDYVNWEKRLVLYYEKQIFEKECQLKMNLEVIKKEYQVKMDMMEKAALEREVKKQKLLHVVNGEPGRDVAMQPVVEQVGETTTCFPGGDTTTVPSHSFNSADTNPQPPITALSNTTRRMGQSCRRQIWYGHVVRSTCFMIWMVGCEANTCGRHTHRGWCITKFIKSHTSH